MADRHRVLVLDELEQLRAGERMEWSGRAVGGLARVLTRRYTDHIVAEHTLDLEERALIDEWALDWLRLVSYTPPITTGQAVAAATLRALDAVHRRSVVEAAVAVAEATSAGGQPNREHMRVDPKIRLRARAERWRECAAMQPDSRYTIYLRDRAVFLDIVADVLREHAERMEVSP